MKSPITGKEMVLIKDKRTLTFRKEEFEVVYHYYKCEESGESFTTTQLDELNLNQIYNQYRIKYKLPFPDEIKLIREKYGLSLSKMSEVLGFGANVYRNYEAGEVPNQSNARLIQLAKDAREFKKLIELSDAFEGKTLEKILQKIESIIQEEKSNRFKTQLEQYFLGTCRPNVKTGYRLPNLERFTEMVVFFTEKMNPLKTMLNRLLFYADFGMYRKAGTSISGVQYRATQRGPVPNNYQSIFEFLGNQGAVAIHTTIFPNGNEGAQFEPNPKRSFNPKIFSEQELATMEEVVDHFRNYSTSGIGNISHLEITWIENERGKKIIDYNYEIDLNQILSEPSITPDSQSCICCD